MLDTIFLIAAIVGGTIMVCQFLLTLFGLGDDGGIGHDGGFHGDAHVGGDFHGDAGGLAGDHPTSLGDAADGGLQHPDSSWLFSVISVRTLIAAGAFFGVAGRAAKATGLSNTTSLLVALAAGLAAMYGMYWLMQAIAAFETSGNERIGNAVGRKATVYVPIPASGAGAGKVQLSMQNRIVEFQAVTDEEERLRTGENVEVVAIAGSDVVRVRRAPAPVEA